MLAFDVLAPVAAIAALLYVGVALAWPLWWVSLCSVLCLLIVQGAVVNGALFRRDGVTVGTDDDGPGLRLGVVGVAAVALVTAVVVGYLQWTVPQRDDAPRHRRSGGHRQQRRRGLGHVQPAEPERGDVTGSYAMMSKPGRTASAANSTPWQRIWRART